MAGRPALDGFKVARRDVACRDIRSTKLSHRHFRELDAGSRIDVLPWYKRFDRLLRIGNGIRLSLNIAARAEREQHG